jgi:hypothetical protein
MLQDYTVLVAAPEQCTLNLINLNTHKILQDKHEYVENIDSVHI